MRRRFGSSAAMVALCAFACGRSGSVPAAPTGDSAAAAKPAADLAGTRVAFDFLTNRAHVLVHRDGRLVMETGDVSFLKFIDGGWKSSWILGLKDGGKPVAFVSGLSSTLFVPIDADGGGVAGQALGDVKVVLTMRALAPKQRVSVFANEKPVATLDVGTSYAPHELVVPASALVLGENRFRFTFRAAAPLPGGKRAAAAIERIEIGPATAPAGSAGEALRTGDISFGQGSRRALSTTGPSRLSYYVQVPAGGRLALSHGSPTAGTTVAVRISKDGAAPQTLFEGATSAQWNDVSWDLSAYGDEAIRLDLVTKGGGASWGAPRFLVKAPAAPPAPAPQKFDRVFVWMVDTLRADKVHVYNPKTNVLTPNYDAFAADATRFAWNQVPGTWSLPSHASILTGVYPTVHKAVSPETKVSRDVPFVAELYKKAGYRTAMFSSNGYVSGKWGFDRAWDINRNFIRESLPNGADYLWKTAKTWILGNGAKPQFVYLATVEPHVIYNPKKEFLVKYWNKPYHGPIKPALTGIQLGQIKSGKLKINDTDKAYLEALHNAEITQSDAAFHTFISDLKAAGVYETSAVIVISDHGDEFWDHGDVGHAQSVHQELVHVPLIIRAPGVFPKGRVVQADVEAMDLFPTMLELAGIPLPPDTQGSALLALVRDEVAFSPRAALSQNLGISRGLKVGRFRLIHSGHMELYDEFRDPLEKSDLVGKRPIALRSMRNIFSLIVAYESRWKKKSWGTAANLAESFYASVGS